MSIRRKNWKRKKRGQFKKGKYQKFTQRNSAGGCGYDCPFCHGLDFVEKYIGSNKYKYSEEYLKKFDEMI